MKKVISCFIFILLSSAQLKAQQVIDSLVGPESVIKVGDKLFVSNSRGGFISELSTDGKFLRKYFQKSVLNAPKGLAAIDSTLYVTDTSRIVGFNINSGEQVYEFFLPDAKFLNDLCKVDKQHLVVTDSKTNKIHLVNTPDKSIRFLGSVAGANGVTYNEKTKQVFACGVGPGWNSQGKLYWKDLNKTDTVFTELQNSPIGFFDGVELMDDDHLIVDDWSNKGRLFVYNLKDHSSISYTLNCGTADLYYDKASGNVYIPDLPANRIVIKNIKNLQKD